MTMVVCAMVLVGEWTATGLNVTVFRTNVSERK